jgi:hypothetical protein
MERAGQVVTVYKKGSLTAACKGSYRTGKLRATQNREDWCVWASRAAIEARTEDGDRMDRGAAGTDRICDAMTEANVGLGGGTGGAATTARKGALLRRPGDGIRGLKQRLDSIHLTADGVVPLDLDCHSSREALLGPAAAAYTRNGILVATDGSLKKNGIMGAAMVAKDGRLASRSVAVFGQPSSIRPELTGIALAVEDCPREEDLNILTDSLSAMK